ncbi:hypothetical protein FACS189427_01270 [Planctomycetales bacterium]|nr:hypothetical protein FACS189427_01270 [Planctomycetales bacterium]
MNIEKQNILTPLQSIQRRIRLRRCGFGLLLAFCAFPLTFFLILLLIPNPKNISAVMFSAVLFHLIAGSLFGWIFPLKLSAAAVIADKHCRLSDRLLTAVSLLQKEQNSSVQNTLTAMERLQIEDTAASAKKIVVREITLPSVISRFKNYALIYFAVLLLLYSGYWLVKLSPAGILQENYLPEHILEVDAVDDSADMMLSDTQFNKMRKIAAQNKTAPQKEIMPDKEISENKLSSAGEINDAVRNSLRRWDTAAKIAAMNDIADALDASEATKKAAEALKGKRYSEAANELNQMDSDLISTMTKQERKEVAAMLKEAIQKTKDRGQKPLADTVEKMKNALDDNALKMGEAEGFSELADESRKLALQQHIEQEKENRTKNQNATLSFTQGSGDGGKKAEKSNQEGKNWGTGEAGDPASGQTTEMKNEKRRQELSGIIGEGASEYEKAAADNTPAKKTEREYQELHYAGRKVTEEVLSKEPLPLEQRQTLRRYFDLLQQEND